MKFVNSVVEDFGLTIVFLYLITSKELIFTGEIIHKYVKISLYIQKNHVNFATPNSIKNSSSHGTHFESHYNQQTNCNQT